ncbi:hypothetical protein SAM40697_3130 [Streptomyces ambofaciens]|uniref:Uncharacterized protein n=1 Tax=Streptomyces ambofaciens TaxID=1889 RepID=A0ABM6B0E1_STRAM|nr:hypothetical protein SAM40697_3130 [Streptomyces ambofaciens]
MASPPGAVAVGVPVPAGGLPCGRSAPRTGAPVAVAPFGTVGVVAPAPDGRAGEEAGPGAAPGSPRSPSADDGAVPGGPEGAFVVRRLAGRDRRCTAADPEGAWVRGCRGRGAPDGTGDTRTPRAARVGALAGASDEAGPVGSARRTGGAGAVDAGSDAPEGAVAGEAAGPAPVPRTGPEGAAGAVAGSARSGATGIRCTGAVPAGDADGCDGAGPWSPAPGRAGSANAPDSMPLPAAGFSTAGDGAPVNDGFCHVGSRPPNPASATPVRAFPVARWIGGRPVQAATATGAGSVVREAPSAREAPSVRDAPSAVRGTPAAVPAVRDASAVLAVPTGPPPVAEPVGTAGGVLPPAPSRGPSRRPRSRSRNPTAQPPAAPRVTRDAIWSVYRRRSWCSRSRIASRLQWKW